MRRDGGAEARPLGAWAETLVQGFADVLLAVADPGHLPGNGGWPLRNLLLLAAVRWGLRRARVVCVRERRGRACPSASILVDAVLPQLPPGKLSVRVASWCKVPRLKCSLYRRAAPH